MKILLINNDKGWSGGQEHLKDLAGELLRHGDEVQFVVRAGGASEIRFQELGPVHPLPAHGLGDIAALWQFVRLLRRERFDVVSINREHDLLLTVLAWRIAFPCGTSGRLMMSYHTATSRPQLLLGAVDGIVCISEHVRTKLLQGNPSAASKATILYYGIDPGAPPGGEKFDAHRPRRYFSGTGFPLIGMVGDFWKNQTELVEMIPKMKKSFPALKVALVGDTGNEGLLKPIRARVRELGLHEDVLFPGRVPREQIPDLFFDFDLSVTTHRNEGFGIVHLESLAAGTAVVTYNEGGMVDIFRGEDVGTVVAGGPREFARGVVDLLLDDDGRFAKGRRGHLLVRRSYSVAAMGERYRGYYQDLLGESP